MIKTLRKKFILINMLLVSAVLITVFTAQCYTRYRQAQLENSRILQIALERRDDQRPRRYEIGQMPPSGFSRSPMFMVRIAPDGVPRLFMEENVSVLEEQLGRIVEDAVKTGKNQGVLSDWSLRYMIKHDDAGVRIAFLDITGDISVMRNTVLVSALFCVLSIVLFLAVSMFLSKWALQPVERAWEQQKRFVADASHELKTPLTVILANVGILKSNEGSTIREQSAWIENTEAEAKRMKWLVDGLLFLAKTDDAGDTAVYDKANLSDAFFSTSLSMESLAFERGIAVDTDGIEPDIHVLGDDAQLKRMIGILLDNAVKYSADGSVVTLKLSRKQNKAALVAHNLGKPIPAEDLERLYERFYRADASRSKEGYGLGLSIAQRIVEVHKGTITAESSSDKGTSFTVELPLYPC